MMENKLHGLREMILCIDEADEIPESILARIPHRLTKKGPLKAVPPIFDDKDCGGNV